MHISDIVKRNRKYVLVKQVSGNQIDENRLLSYVEETLDKDFETELLTSDVKMELNEEVTGSRILKNQAK